MPEGREASADTFDEGWRAAEVAVLSLRGRQARHAHALLEGLRINRRNGDPRLTPPARETTTAREHGESTYKNQTNGSE